MNANGRAENLIARHPGNASAARHHAYSARLRQPRAQEIAEQVMQAPWSTSVDEIGAAEIGRLLALVEALDDAIEQGGVIGKGDKVRDVVDLRLRASRRLFEALAQHGMTPHARAHWTARLVHGSLGERIAARIAELDADE